VQRLLQDLAGGRESCKVCRAQGILEGSRVQGILQGLAGHKEESCRVAGCRKFYYYYYYYSGEFREFCRI
jgi:hypothetical protein